MESKILGELKKLEQQILSEDISQMARSTRELRDRFGWTDRHKGFWPVLLSLTVIVLLFEAPILGIIVWLLVAFAGLGSVVLSK